MGDNPIKQDGITPPDNPIAQGGITPLDNPIKQDGGIIPPDNPTKQDGGIIPPDNPKNRMALHHRTALSHRMALHYQTPKCYKRAIRTFLGEEKEEIKLLSFMLMYNSMNSKNSLLVISIFVFFGINQMC